MVDAVNTTIQQTAAPLPTRSAPVAPPPASTEPVEAPKSVSARFITPFIFVDGRTPVLQVRDSQTGDVKSQIPYESTLRRQTRAGESAPVQSTNAPVETETTQTETTQTTAVSSDTGGVATPPPAEQIAAFENAARAGDTNAGNVTVFA